MDEQVYALSQLLWFLLFLTLTRPVSFDVALSGQVLLSLPVTNYSSPAVTGTHRFFVKLVHVSHITSTKAP